MHLASRTHFSWRAEPSARVAEDPLPAVLDWLFDHPVLGGFDLATACDERTPTGALLSCISPYLSAGVAGVDVEIAVDGTLLAFGRSCEIAPVLAERFAAGLNQIEAPYTLDGASVAHTSQLFETPLVGFEGTGWAASRAAIVSTALLRCPDTGRAWVGEWISPLVDRQQTIEVAVAAHLQGIRSAALAEAAVAETPANDTVAGNTMAGGTAADESTEIMKEEVPA